jgi:hypothetical protein
VEIEDALKAGHCVEPDSEIQVPDMVLLVFSRSVLLGIRWNARSSMVNLLSKLAAAPGHIVSCRTDLSSRLPLGKKKMRR